MIAFERISIARNIGAATLALALALGTGAVAPAYADQPADGPAGGSLDAGEVLGMLEEMITGAADENGSISGNEVVDILQSVSGSIESGGIGGAPSGADGGRDAAREASARSAIGSIVAAAAQSAAPARTAPQVQIDAAPLSTLVVPDQADTDALRVVRTPGATVDAPGAELMVFRGQIDVEGQEDFYSFTAPYDGTYRIDFSEMYAGFSVNCTVTDRLGQVVSEAWYAENGEGLTLEKLVAGETYSIAITQCSSTGAYIASVWFQPAPVPIDGASAVNDNVAFTDQVNVYTFVPEIEGAYRFDIREMMSGVSVDMTVVDRLGQVVAEAWYVENDEGLTVDGLVAGDTYRLLVEQVNDFGSYTLEVGRPHRTVDVAALVNGTPVTSFSALVAGEAPLAPEAVLVDGVPADTWAAEHAYDFGSVVDYVDRFDNQAWYAFTVDSASDLVVRFGNMQNDRDVDVQLLDHLGQVVSESWYIGNDETFSVEGLVPGEQYRLLVEYDHGDIKMGETFEYTLTFVASSR